MNLRSFRIQDIKRLEVWKVTLAFQDGQELSGARSNANQLWKFCRSCHHTWLSCEPAKSRLFIATCAFANDVTVKTPPPSGFYGFVPNKGEEFASQEHLHCMQLQLLVALQAPMKFRKTTFLSPTMQVRDQSMWNMLMAVFWSVQFFYNADVV